MANNLIHYKKLLKIKTPNTYGENYSQVPKKSGIYFFVAPCRDKRDILDTILGRFNYYEIIYIGSSKNLYNRYSGHELRGMKIFGLKFYFIESNNYYEDEIKLIKYHNPVFNKQHNKMKCNELY